MGFRVRLEPAGKEFTIEDKETVLEAAMRHGIILPYSCRNGACATCKGRILSGSVDYGEYEAHALSDEERAAGMALFCQAVPLEDVVIEAREISAAEGIVIKTLPCRVVKMEKLSHDVMALDLKLPEGERLQYLPGQYVDILLRDGNRRSFSLASALRDDALLQLHIRHVPGGHFSGHVFTGMKERDLLRFRGPLGTFFLRRESERPVILMAGGTGFAPIKAILEHALASGIDRPMHLFWGARARRDLYLHELALSWAGSHDRFRYTPVLSEPAPEDRWDGRGGWVHEAVVEDYPDLREHEIYASGPPPMVEAGKQVFMQHGLAEDRYFHDSFEFAHDVA